jgi:branched-chain amino acid transport system substrate-binding protein
MPKGTAAAARRKNTSAARRQGVKPNYHAAAQHSSLQILEAAVKKAGSFDPQKLRDAMASITVQTIQGPWKANEQGFSTIEGVTIQIQNGERVIV